MPKRAEEKDTSLSATLKWWPSVAGVALAGFVAAGGSADRDAAPILAASGFVYLGAAALRQPSVAWPLFFVTFFVITASRMGVVPFDPTWTILALGAMAFLYGVWQGAGRPLAGLSLQTFAMVAVGAAAALASVVNSATGAYLVATGLFGHSGWDVYHHRKNRVVGRTMAEFCCVLDAVLGAAIVVTVLRG